MSLSSWRMKRWVREVAKLIQPDKTPPLEFTPIHPKDMSKLERHIRYLLSETTWWEWKKRHYLLDALKRLLDWQKKVADKQLAKVANDLHLDAFGVTLVQPDAQIDGSGADIARALASGQVAEK